MPSSEDRHDARALWITGNRRCELRAGPVERAEGEILVESRFGAISRGTERLVFEGRVPASEHERMRGPAQGGEFPFPVKYGYAVVGEVAEATGRLGGRTVFALHPHQDRFFASPDRLVPLPDALPPERAVLAANMETALNIVWDAAILPGDRVAVVGGGLVGSLTASLVGRIAGTAVTLVDVDPARAEVAGALGVGFAAPEAAEGECDVVIHTSGHAAGLATSLRLCGYEASVVEASWYGEGDVAVPLGQAFHSRRLCVRASQVGAVPSARRARWTHRRRLETALALLDDPRLDILISGESAFSELADRYAAILQSPQTLCHRIRYR